MTYNVFNQWNKKKRSRLQTHFNYFKLISNSYIIVLKHLLEIAAFNTDMYIMSLLRGKKHQRTLLVIKISLPIIRLKYSGEIDNQIEVMPVHGLFIISNWQNKYFEIGKIT